MRRLPFWGYTFLMFVIPIRLSFQHLSVYLFFSSCNQVLSLGVLRELGGIVLPPGTLLLGIPENSVIILAQAINQLTSHPNLEKIGDLQRYESTVYYQRPQQPAVGPAPPLILMAHRMARMVPAAIELARPSGGEPHAAVDPVTRIVTQYPEYVHQFTEGILEADSPLLNSTRGTDLVRILDNRIILLDPAQLDSYTDTNICEALGSIPALLRRAWYGMYSFVEPNTTLPISLIKEDGYEY